MQDERREQARAELENIGFIARGAALKPWQQAVLPKLMKGTERSKAYLDFVVASAIDNGLAGLTRATDRPVASSDDNTRRIEAVATQLNCITKWAAVAAHSAIAAVLSLIAAWRTQPDAAPVVQVHPAVTVTAPSPVRASPVAPPAAPRQPARRAR